MAYSCKVLSDTVNVCGDRLFVAEFTANRSLLAQFNTHRELSRSGMSLRAIPVWKIIQSVIDEPVIPVFKKNQKGMQGGEKLEGEALALATEEWLEGSRDAVLRAYNLADRNTKDKETKIAWAMIEAWLLANNRKPNKQGLKVHKEETNRILEAYLWHKGILGFTNGSNLFALRIHKDAQEGISKLVNLIYDARENSTPKLLQPGQWALPKISEEEKLNSGLSEFELAKISSIRCARISYLREDEVRPFEKDLEQYNDFVNAWPKHLSPMEFPSQALDSSTSIGNYKGWKQLRKYVKDEYIESFEKPHE